MTGSIQPEWRTEHMIRSYDVDPNCVARLPVFCRYMQEAAYFHAEHFGLGHSHLSPSNMTWVLSRMRMEVSRLPHWGDAVRLRTWPSGRDRLFYYRDFEFLDGDGNLLLLASTAWFVIDFEKRERVIPEWWSGCDLPIGPKVFSAKLRRLKECGCAGGHAVPVNYGDLDQNGHVSNIRYVEWILNSLPLDYHQVHMIKSLEVNYLAEAVYGHDVSVCEKREGLSINHGVNVDGEDLFRAQSIWDRIH